MIRFDNLPPEVMQAMCTPMHLILPPSPPSASAPASGPLFLGSLSALSDPAALRSSGVTHLVQVLDVPWLPPLEEQGFVCYKIKIDDTEDEGRVDLRTYLAEATAWIDGVLRRGGGVLVHCQQGVSRSPAIIIAFLMRFRGMSFDAASSLTRHRRACIKPNAAFVRALRDWEITVGTGNGGGGSTPHTPRSGGYGNHSQSQAPIIMTRPPMGRRFTS